MRFKKGLLLYNNQAGKKRAADIKKIIAALHEAVEHIEERIISASGNGEKLCFCLGVKYDIIIIYGGDGTVHECINGIARLEERPVVAILPGGTCNDFSRSLGIPESPEEACKLLKTGGIRAVDVGAVNDRHFINFWGIGLIADTSENIKESKKNVIGKMSYYLSALETMYHPSDFYYMIQTDKEVLEGKAVMVAALNGNYIGAVDLPFKADHKDGYLDLVIVKEAGFPLIKEFIHTKKIKMTGEHKADLIHRKVKSFSVFTERPMQVDMDGEVYATTPAVCHAKVNHIRFISAT